VLVLVVAAAASLRLVGIRHGLSARHTQERELVARAWRMSHGGGFDPHWFRAPSGLLDLLALVEAPFGQPSVLAARIALVVVACAAVAATWWLASTYGQVAGGVAAALVAAETVHVARSHTVSPGVAVTLPLAVALALLARDRLVLAGLATGLAVSVEYRAVLLLVPLLLLGWRRRGTLALAGTGVLAGFLALTPFAALHPRLAAADAWHSAGAATDGGGLAVAGQLWDGFGPVLFVCVLGLVLAVAQRRDRADLTLASFAVVALGTLLAFGSPHAASTLVLVPALAALAARVRYLAAVTVILLAIPLTWAIRADAKLVRVGPVANAVVRLSPCSPPRRSCP
jgi:uncharacterized membrane protein